MDKIAMPFSKKQLFRYAVLPEFRPRLAQLFTEGFNYIPYFIALVYQAVRLLPEHHPYANPANLGKFGIRHVIGEAANHLVVSRRNIDQLVLFVSILAGLAIIMVQLCILVGGLMFQPLLAAPPLGLVNYFTTPVGTQDTDLAHMMLDLVFGIPDIFNSCVSTAALCQDLNGNPITNFANPMAAAGMIGPLAPGGFLFFPFAIHDGLHSMFAFYSLGLLVVAIIISLYFIITIIAETAQTGTAFGKRFNRVWAPLRFVIAFGLLVPAGYGLNAAQYIVLYAAKYGSGFATRGWNHFNGVLVDSYVGDVARLVTRPTEPEAEIGRLLQFFFIARTCKEAEEMASMVNDAPTIDIQPYLVRNVFDVPNALPVNLGTSYAQMINFAGGATSVSLRFGVRKSPNGYGDPDDVDENDTDYGRYKGFVKPICGEIKVNLTDPRNPATDNMGTQALQEYYWFILKELWFTAFNTSPGWLGFPPNYPLNFVEYFGNRDQNPFSLLPGQLFKTQLTNFYLRDMTCVLTGLCGAFPPPTPRPVIALQIASGAWAVPPALLDKGWAGAGIWYNRIAELNGAVTTAVYNIPTVSLYPFVMEYVKAKKEQYDQETLAEEIYLPLLADRQDVPFQRPEDAVIARILNAAYVYWMADDGLTTSHTETTGNILIDSINMLLGTSGLYSMRRNNDIHPLAQLVGVGRALVESSVRNMVGAGVAKVFQPFFGEQLATVAAGFFVTLTMIGLTAGFILFYVVPFLPFIYFFFAVGGWIKGIFEAMVGAPLWALAHIRIDGEGLPGQAANNGYFLLFEILVRPVLIIFGLLAGISIFSASVIVLNSIFDLVVSNFTGYDVACEAGGCGPSNVVFYRSPIDEFFFTGIYVVTVYMLGTSSFKLVDQIPNQILRWIGITISTFQEEAGDPAGQVTSQAYRGTTILATQATGGRLASLM